MEKDLRFSVLYDFYGQLLSGSMASAVELYYNDDLSLGETAAEMGISRQGVRDAVKRGERQLLDFEEKLGLLRRFNEIGRGIEDIDDCCRQLLACGAEPCDCAQRILCLTQSIKEKL